MTLQDKKKSMQMSNQQMRTIILEFLLCDQHTSQNTTAFNVGYINKGNEVVVIIAKLRQFSKETSYSQSHIYVLCAGTFSLWEC